MAEVNDILAEILRLRGAEYVCLADRANGRLIGEAGRDDSVTFPGVVVRLERMVSEVLGPGSDDELDDLMISSRYRYHLIRHVDSVDTPPLLLYLRLQRNRANLAAARRELASTELENRLVGILRSHDGRDRDDSATSITGKPDSVYFTRSARPEPTGPIPTATPAPRPRPMPAPDPTPTPRPMPAPGPTPMPAPGPTHQPGRSPGVESAPDAVLPPLPRRAPTPSRAGRVEREHEREPEPDEPGNLPTVLRQSWAFDRNTMERLVHGLRRMMS